MALSNEISNDVSTIISTPWDVRRGQVVPRTGSIKLSGGAVELDAVFLYADLARSSRLARVLDRRVATKISKSFLATTTKLIRKRGGTVTSFDGDRVLGVFVGDLMNTRAAKCALNVKWTVDKIIRPKFEAKYEPVRKLDFKISHAVGIDSGTLLIVRAGARGNNDLISIGRAPGLAAKLSEIREAPYSTFVSARVYNKLAKSSKYGGRDNDENMWQKRSYKYLDQKIAVFRSNWHWEP